MVKNNKKEKEKEIIKRIRQKAKEATALCNEIQEEVFKNLLGIEAAYGLDLKKIEISVKKAKEKRRQTIIDTFEKAQEYIGKLAPYWKDEDLKNYEPGVSKRVKKFMERLIYLEGCIFSE